MRSQQKRGTVLAERIAKVAADLFYREGINIVGMDRIANAAMVTKKTVYKHYPSKERLIAAAIARAPTVSFPTAGTPAERLVGAFRAAADVIAEYNYRGCPFINAAAELANPQHAGRAVIREIIDRRHRWFRNRAAEAGAPDPDLLADELELLFDGASVAMAKSGDQRSMATAARAAQSLIAAVTCAQSP